MGPPSVVQSNSSPAYAARAYPPAWRLIAALLTSIVGLSFPLLLVLVWLADDPPISPLMLLRAFTLLIVLPGLAVWLIGRAFTVAVELRPDELIVWRRDLRLEVPCATIGQVRPWIIPLPGSGFALTLRSGRRLRYGLQLRDPTALVQALAACGVDGARAALAHQSLAYAGAKAACTRRRWYHWLGRYVVFALGPTAVLFNAHQHIAYGGTFGQYYLVGLAAYARTFAVYWSTVVIYLALYASVWRAGADGVSLLAAWVAPARARAVRRATELACQVGYYGGVPVLLALRFMA